MTIRVHVICDFCKQQSPTYVSVGGATTHLVRERGWTLMVIKRKTRHRCNQCTQRGATELATVKP